MYSIGLRTFFPLSFFFFTQRDYSKLAHFVDETYAPVTRMRNFRSLVAIANEYDLELHHLDVKTASLNGELEKKVSLKIPERLKEYLGSRLTSKKHSFELVKTIYEL